MTEKEIIAKIQEIKKFFEELKKDAHNYDLLTMEEDIIDLCTNLIEKINEKW